MTAKYDAKFIEVQGAML